MICEGINALVQMLTDSCQSTQKEIGVCLEGGCDCSESLEECVVEGVGIEDLTFLSASVASTEKSAERVREEVAERVALHVDCLDF